MDGWMDEYMDGTIPIDTYVHIFKILNSECHRNSILNKFIADFHQINIWTKSPSAGFLCSWTDVYTVLSFLGDSNGKESPCNAEDQGLIPGLGSSSGEGNDYPFQYSCLKNSIGRWAW